MSLVEQFELPDGAIPNGCVAVCQYMTIDGEMEFAVKYDTADMPLSSTLGLLTLAQHHIYEISQEE